MRAYWYDSTKAIVKNEAGREVARLTCDDKRETWTDEVNDLTFSSLTEAEAFYLETANVAAKALAEARAKKANVK